jgi:hypothetical protein
MAELADAADSKSAEAYHLVGVRPPLPAPESKRDNAFAESEAARPVASHFRCPVLFRLELEHRYGQY